MDNCYYEKVGSEVKNIDDEIPFEIPESWCWVRLKQICKNISDGTHKTPTYVDKGIPFLSVKDISNGYIDFSKTKYISQEEHFLLTQRCNPEENDVLICRIGTLGKAIKINCSNEFSIFVSLGLIKPIISEIADYLVTIINSGYGFSWIEKNKVGGGTHTFKINLEDLRMMLLPIPPLNEQERIINNANNFNSLIENYHLLEYEKTKLDGEIYDKLKKSILQYAIQGKLVKQDENDEPASILLERIRAEKKAQLGKKYVESYIYKGDDNCYYEKVGKNEPVLVEDLPFDIPDTWAWARLKDVVEINPRNSVDDETMVSFVEMKSLKDGFNNSFVYEKRAWKAVKSGFTHFQNGDVGFAKITPCFQNRKSAIFNELENGYGAGTTELHILRPYKNTMLANYLLWFVKSPYLIEYGKQKFSGTAGQQRFGTDEVKNTLIPIPPQAEQERICIKIREVLNRIEKDEI